MLAPMADRPHRQNESPRDEHSRALSHRTALAMAATLGAAAFLIPGPLGAQGPQAGRYVIVDAEAATRARDAAIDRVVAQMSFLVRGIARRRLRAGTPIHRHIRIDPVAGELRVRIGEAYDFRAPPDGTPRRFTDGFGNELQGRMSLEEDRLLLVFRGEDAVVRHTLRRTEAGLRFRLRIHSSRLPADVSYRARYRRLP